MTNADIANAKRLNPQRRMPGGGETLEKLTFKNLSKEYISSSGKIILKN